MALGVLDKLLTYSFKGALRVVHYFESYRWERARALITGQVALFPIWGCSSVKLHYRFDSEGRSGSQHNYICVDFFRHRYSLTSARLRTAPAPQTRSRVLSPPIAPAQTADSR
jgi:hypothetical protein